MTQLIPQQVITTNDMFYIGKNGDLVMYPTWIQWHRAVENRVGGASSDLISSDGNGSTLKLTAGPGVTINFTPTAAIVSSSGVTSVNVSGDGTGLFFTGGPITSSGTITMGGVLGVANGGTNATTPQGAINNLLPSQAGKAGLFLQTDGANVSWQFAADIVSDMAYAGAI